MIEVTRFWDGAKDLIQDALRQHKAREHIVTRVGQVTVIDATNFRCSVRLTGDSSDTTRVSYNRDMTINVGDYVLVLVEGSRKFFVLCRSNAVV